LWFPNDFEFRYFLSHATGHLSGGHFGNPVISLTMLFSRRLSFSEYGVYFFSQLMGSLLGGALVLGTRANPKGGGGGKLASDVKFDDDNLVFACTTGVSFSVDSATADVEFTTPTVSEGGLFLSEMLACTILCLVVLSCCDPATQLSPTSGPHAIGMTVVAIHLASDYNIGANFLRSFTSAVVANDQDCWAGHYVFWVAAVVGALLATMIYGAYGWLGRPGASFKKKQVGPM